MARITYRTRLQDLLAKSYLSPRDRTFSQSLLDHYNRKKYMGAGRARCVRQLEERYASKPEINSNLLNEMSALADRITESDSWDAEFMGSIAGQVGAGRDLSEKQREIVDKIRARYSDTAIAAAASWSDTYRASPEKQASFAMMVAYYRKNGYYSNVVKASDAGGDDWTPSMKQYNAVCDNKYAAKILSGWFGEAKYPAGSFVGLRSTNVPRDAYLAAQGRPCVVVGINVATPTSACRGNKIYRILPVGCALTFEVEERGLKTHRQPKKKKA